MDLIQNILDFLLSPIIISFATLFLMIAIVTTVPVSARKRLYRFRREYREYLVGKTVFPVSYFSQEDIAGRNINARLAKRGFVVIGSADEAVFFILTGRDKYLRYEFTINGCEVAYLDNDKFGNMLPSMTRLHEDGRSHYMYCTGWLGTVDIKKTRRLLKQLSRVLTSKHVPPTDRKSGNTAVLAALLVVIGMAVFLVWSSWDDTLEYVPMVLAKTDDGDVFVASPRILYLFDHKNTLTERIKLEELGIKGGLSDIQVLESHQLLVGDSSAGVIKQCDLTERTCKTLSGFNDEPLFLRAFQFHYNEQRARIYAADSSRHRLLELSKDGKLIRELANNELLCFPNEPVVVGDKLYLANTNHHEIIEWNLDDGFVKPSRRWFTVEKGRSDVNCPAAVEATRMAFFARERSRPSGERALPFKSGRRGRVWPFSIAFDNAGSWWVINGGAGLQYGDIFKISSDTAAGSPERIVLPDDSDPIALLPRSEDILIVETEKPSIIRVGLDGRNLGYFGGPEFLSEMGLLTERRKQRSQYQFFGIYLTGGLLVLIISMLLLFRHFRIRHIIEQDPAFQTRQG